MAFTVKLNGSWVNIDPGASWQQQAGSRDTFTCDVTSPDGSYVPVVRWPAEVYEDGVLVLGGVISFRRTVGALGEPLQAVTTQVTISSHKIYVERRLVNGIMPAGSVADALHWLQPFLDEFGTTVDVAQPDGPDLPERRYDYVPASDVWADIIELTGWIPDISAANVMSAAPPSSNPAPYSLAALDGNTDGDVTVEQSIEGFANDVVVKYSAEARTAYGFAVASGNPSPGDTVGLGSQTYTWVSSSPTASGDVLIGATAAESLANLVAAIVRGDGAGTIYGEPTTANASASAYVRNETMITAVAVAAGVSGNSIAVAATGSAIAWIGEGSSPIDTLVFGADRSLSNTAFASDDDSIAEYGSWGWREEREDITSADEAQAVADAVLARRLVVPASIEYPTLQTGARAGQSQPVDLPIRGVDGDFVIATVTATEDTNGTVRRQIMAHEGEYVRDTDDDVIRGWSGGATATRAAVVAIASEPTPPVITRARTWLAVSGVEWAACSSAGVPVPLSAIRMKFNRAAWGSDAGTVYARIRSRSGAARVVFWDVTVGAMVAESADVTATSLTWAPAFPVTMIDEHEYEIRGLGTVGVDINAVVYVE